MRAPCSRTDAPAIECAGDGTREVLQEVSGRGGSIAMKQGGELDDEALFVVKLQLVGRFIVGWRGREDEANPTCFGTATQQMRAKPPICCGRPVWLERSLEPAARKSGSASRRVARMTSQASGAARYQCCMRPLRLNQLIQENQLSVRLTTDFQPEASQSGMARSIACARSVWR